VHESRKGTARLSTMTHSVPWRCRELWTVRLHDAAEVCGLRIADADPQ